MKQLKVITALAIGIMASTSGVVQVEAANRFFFVDYATKEVTDFTPYRQSFNDATSSLTNSFTWTMSAEYKFDSCSGTSGNVNATFTSAFRKNNTGAFTFFIEDLPDLPCVVSYTNYSITKSGVFNNTFLDTIVDDDTDFLTAWPIFSINHPASYNGKTLDFINLVWSFDFYYDFNTTYLFNTFLSDSQRTATYNVGFTFPTATTETFLEYVYTQAGNDIDTIYNDPGPADIGTARKKYAIDFPDVFFRGERIGLRYAFLRPNMRRVMPSGGVSEFAPNINYYYFNVSNFTQPIVNAPIFNFEEEDCGDFLSLNVGCFINNAFAYITNDAPIVSDAFTLLNAGIEMAAQTFGIIGNFADDNVFGVLILAGFGFIAVKWFLKND
jgi:hypothetical protein